MCFERSYFYLVKKRKSILFRNMPTIKIERYNTSRVKKLRNVKFFGDQNRKHIKQNSSL